MLPRPCLHTLKRSGSAMYFRCWPDWGRPEDGWLSAGGVGPETVRALAQAPSAGELWSVDGRCSADGRGSDRY